MIPVAAETAIAHYMGMGLSKDVATGIAAVLYVESNLNPLAENNSGTDAGGVLNPRGAFGVAQWNGPRQQALVDFATKKRLDPHLLTTQLAFVLTEAANSYPQFWAAIQTPAVGYSDVISAMVAHYEIPANIPAEVDKAMAFAKEWMTEMIVPATPTVPVIPTPAPLPIPASGVDLGALLNIVESFKPQIEAALTNPQVQGEILRVLITVLLAPK